MAACDIRIGVEVSRGPPIPYVQVRLGDTIAAFPDPSLSLADPEAATFAGIRQLAFGADQQSVYVLDPPNHLVHRISLDGVFLGSVGGEGEGPGELKRPVSIQAAADSGVWVLNGMRVTHFRTDGSLVETRSLEGANVTTFAPAEGGELLIPAVTPMASPHALLSRVGAAGVRDMANPGSFPRRLANDPARERHIGWRLAPLGPREFAIVLRGPDLQARRAHATADGQALDSVTAWRMPRRPVETAAAAMTLPDARLSPVVRAGMAGDHFWVVSPGLGWVGPVAFTVPMNPGDPSFYLDAPGFHEPGRAVRDAVVLADRVVIARETGIVIRSVLWPS